MLLCTVRANHVNGTIILDEGSISLEIFKCINKKMLLWRALYHWNLWKLHSGQYLLGRGENLLRTASCLDRGAWQNDFHYIRSYLWTEMKTWWETAEYKRTAKNTSTKRFIWFIWYINEEGGSCFHTLNNITTSKA